MGLILDTKGPLGLELRRESVVVIAAEYDDDQEDGRNAGVFVSTSSTGRQVAVELEFRHVDAFAMDFLKLRKLVQERGGGADDDSVMLVNWSNDQILHAMAEFIDDVGLTRAFNAFLRGKKDQEAEMSEETTDLGRVRALLKGCSIPFTENEFFGETTLTPDGPIATEYAGHFIGRGTELFFDEDGRLDLVTQEDDSP